MSLFRIGGLSFSRSESGGQLCAIQGLDAPYFIPFVSLQFITDVSGAGNNFAHGYAVYGPQVSQLFQSEQVESA